jgi:hypothetical protein
MGLKDNEAFSRWLLVYSLLELTRILPADGLQKEGQWPEWKLIQVQACFHILDGSRLENGAARIFRLGHQSQWNKYKQLCLKVKANLGN